MTYKSVLQSFTPSEEGDFLLRYEIQQKEFVIYSPDDGIISCLSLEGFKKLSPLELAALLNIPPAQIAPGLDEFVFDYSCHPEKLISYLFDVEKLSGNLKVDAKKHQIECIRLGYTVFGYILLKLLYVLLLPVCFTLYSSLFFPPVRQKFP